MKLLIVEDEEALGKSIKAYLQTENFNCEIVGDFISAIEKIELYDYACIILDINLPDGNGLELLNILRADSKNDGVLIISARDSLTDKVTGLTAGADDYLAKPFHLSELLARVLSIIRRRNFQGSNVIEVGDLKLNVNEKTFYFADTILDLTRKEYNLFLYFFSNINKVISKNAIAEHLWGDHMDMAENQDMIYAHIKNLRRKLQQLGAPDYIKSIYGMGYKFAPQ